MGKVIITGANGFLGKNLVNHLAEFGINAATLLDIHAIPAGSAPSIEHDHFAIDLADQSLSELINADDVVIHLAWKSNPSVTGADTEAEMELNWNASKNLIDACIAKNAKLVFISSGGTVYGKPQYLPIDEDHPTNPVSAYGEVKLKVEQAIKDASRRDQLKYAILRPSNLYGPGFSLKKGLGVIGHWVEMIRDGKPIQMVGEGALVRDFIHVDDLCKGILSALEVENETLNIGSGIGVSLKELSLIFEGLTQRPLDIQHLEDRKFDVDMNVLSIGKIQQLTGWSPKISLEEGINRLLAES